MEVMNTTPQEYLDYRRLEEAKKTKGTFEEKAVAVGYIDTSHMTKACSRTHNLTLNEFFKKENT